MSSRNSLPPRKLLAVMAAVAGLTGCADYLNHHDTVTLRAGDSQRWNSVVQTTDPWPPYVKNTDINVDGQRAAVGIRRYSSGAGSSASGQESPGGAGAAEAGGAAR